MNEFMANDVIEGAGWTTFFLAVGSGIIELLTQIKLNDILQLLLSIGGLVFLWFKIKLIILDVKIRKKTLNEDDNKKE